MPAPRVPDCWIRPGQIKKLKGSRAGQLADVQLVCGAGPYELDVLVRELEGPHGVDFVGQITRADCIHEPVSELTLTLVSVRGEESVGDTNTNEFGEFAFGRQPDSAYGLRLGASEDAPCVLVWEGAA